MTTTPELEDGVSEWCSSKKRLTRRGVVRGVLASNTLPLCRNGDAYPFTRHLFQEKGNLTGDIKSKPFAAPQKPVDEGHGAGGHEGRHLHQSPKLAAGSGELPVVLRGGWG